MTLVCSASSRPGCDFYWHINNQASVLSTGPALTFLALKPLEGNYTCVARNPVTGVTLHRSTPFVVGEERPLCRLSRLQQGQNIQMLYFPSARGAGLQVPSYGAWLLGVLALSLTTSSRAGGLSA